MVQRERPLNFKRQSLSETGPLALECCPLQTQGKLILRRICDSALGHASYKVLLLFVQFRLDFGGGSEADHEDNDGMLDPEDDFEREDQEERERKRQQQQQQEKMRQEQEAEKGEEDEEDEEDEQCE